MSAHFTKAIITRVVKQLITLIIALLVQLITLIKH